jgi:ATP-binding cassette, subfamily B, bacterial PglK
MRIHKKIFNLIVLKENKKVFEILSVLENKKIYVVGIFLLLISIMDIISLGSLPILVGSLLNEDFINDNNFEFLGSFRFYLSFDRIFYFVFFIFLFKAILNLIFLIYQTYFYRDLYSNLSSKLFKHYLFEKYLVINKYSTSILIRNLINEVNLVIEYLKTYVNFFKEILFFLIIFIGCIFLNWKITLIVFSLFLVFVLLFSLIFKSYLTEMSILLQVFREKQLQIINQTFRAIQDIKVSLIENFISKSYKQNVKKRYSLESTMQIIASSPRIILEFLVVGSLLIFMIYILKNNYSNDKIIGVLSLVTIISVRFIPTFNIIMSSLAKFKSLTASINLLSKEFERKNFEYIKEKVNLINFKKNIKFENLNFSYDDALILKSLNLSINKGDFIGIYGKSGSGKSTLLNILSGLINSKEGYFNVDDQPITSKNILNWFNTISYVPQNNFIFDDSIKNNICLFIDENEIDQKLLEKSIYCSALEDLGIDINTFMCGEGGKYLSFGQKQRLAIARAIYQNKSIIILDECTSNLDDNTEQKIIQRFKIHLSEKTGIIVSHKFSSLKLCNKIFEMKEGNLNKKVIVN